MIGFRAGGLEKAIDQAAKRRAARPDPYDAISVKYQFNPGYFSNA